MADPTSTNLNLLLMSTGTASGQWGSLLDSSVFTIVDQALGSSQAVALSSTDVTLTMAQRQNLRFALSGTLTNSVSVKLPFVTNSTTVAVGGFFIFDNQCTGAFTVTVKTVASGSTGVDIPQGVRATVVSDGTNVTFADDTQNQTKTVSGNPNGSVAGTAGSASTRADRIIDRSTNQEYLCTTSGTASSAAWSVNLPYAFPSQGYLTPNSDAQSPVLTGDSVGATTLYYTGINGNLFWVYNGISLVPVAIPNNQMSLALSSSSQASNGIYDVIGFLQNGNGTATIGFSPAWGTATAGAGARGTGAGTPQLVRTNGILTNAVQQTVNSGATTYTVAATRGTYLGSVYIDSSAGQVSCYRSYGQSRKWGVWNAYNRMPVYLKAGDGTASWNYNSATVRASDGSANNSLTLFSGIAEDTYDLRFSQVISSLATANSMQIGIGYNSTTVMSGQTATFAWSNSIISPTNTLSAAYIAAPAIGVNVITALEAVPLPGGATNQIFNGTEAKMLLGAWWRA